MKRHICKAIFSLLAVCFAIVAQAAVGWMSGEDITVLFSDATIDGQYANGRSFTEHYAANGRVEYAEPGLTIGGRWSVTAGTLCTIYDTDVSGGCFRVARVAENCFEFYFAARTEQAAPGPEGSRPKWTARGAFKGKAAACPDGADV